MITTLDDYERTIFVSRFYDPEKGNLVRLQFRDSPLGDVTINLDDAYALARDVTSVMKEIMALESLSKKQA